MIKATQPFVDDHANYAHVIAHRKTLVESEAEALRAEELQEAVFDLYQKYEERFANSAGPTPEPDISKADQDVLKTNSNYLRLTHFDSIKGAILTATQGNKCPYCYQLRASQIDHYLPKAHFGEYAIFVPNLVPICNECNGKKLNRYVLPGGGRRYVHPYFDQLPSNSFQYLDAEISIGSSVSIKFSVVRPTGVSDEVWCALRNQFVDLDLGRRYMEDATETMMSMLGSIYTHYERGGRGELRYQLEIEQHSKQLRYGRNHWWAVTLDTLAQSDLFCHGGFKALGPDPKL